MKNWRIKNYKDIEKKTFEISESLLGFLEKSKMSTGDKNRLLSIHTRLFALHTKVGYLSIVQNIKSEK